MVVLSYQREKKCFTEWSWPKFPASPEVQGFHRPLRLRRLNQPFGWLFLTEKKTAELETLQKDLFGGTFGQGEPCGSRVLGRRIWMLVFQLSLYFSLFCQLVHLPKADELERSGLSWALLWGASQLPCQHRLWLDGWQLPGLPGSGSSLC